jgi:predicted DNA-binding WGR domain protein
MERIFHLSEGTAHKFWCIVVEGETQTVRFGRIGTAGQTQTKTFGTPDEANASTNRLIAEKVKKGYAEVSADEAAIVAPKPLPRQKLTPWRQMLLPFDDPAPLPERTPVPPPTKPAPPPAATLERF